MGCCFFVPSSHRRILKYAFWSRCYKPPLRKPPLCECLKGACRRRSNSDSNSASTSTSTSTSASTSTGNIHDNNSNYK